MFAAANGRRNSSEAHKLFCPGLLVATRAHRDIIPTGKNKAVYLAAKLKMTRTRQGSVCGGNGSSHLRLARTPFPSRSTRAGNPNFRAKRFLNFSFGFRARLPELRTTCQMSPARTRGPLGAQTRWRELRRTGEVNSRRSF